jgi:phosphatidylserine/phosphatidylglycerophosphate/cardiolipin synthase-like enzyme
MFDYKPVLRVKRGSYNGAALIGTYSAVIGWSFDDPALRKGLKGFAIRRTKYDKASEELLEVKWLGGYKRFKLDDDDQPDDVGSLTAPFQRFRWNDYSLRPDCAYKFEVFPMRGKPGWLTKDESPLVFKFCPSQEDDGKLGVYVNRGVTAAKAYFNRFGDLDPSEVEPATAAYNWLSRGLKESLLGFIHSAKSGDKLHVAVYEFHDAEVAQAFKDALARGVEVSILHDAKAGKRSTKESNHIIAEFGLESVRTKRTKVNISHNKLVVLLRKNKPIRAWTGSANFSENAFNYQTNTALVVKDKRTIVAFEKYFQSLLDDPAKAHSKDLNRALMDEVNQKPNCLAEKTFFSPIRKLEILDTAVDLIANAKHLVLISAPFGVDKRMIEAIEKNDRALVEYGLSNSTAKKKIAGLNHHNTRFFPPNRLKTYQGERWDAKAFGAHKIHAKTIVVDPFSNNPKVLIGSANFSTASCRDNDENAMLIVGDKRLAAIIATEFMRMYDHYKSRYYIDKNNDINAAIRKDNKLRKAQGLPPKPEHKIDPYLKDDESWSKTSFDQNSFSHKCQDRIVFSGEK